MKRKRHPSYSAFTLIELLVVIAVLGVLATIVIIVVNPQAQILKAQVSATQATLKQMKTEVEGMRVLKNQTFFQITGNGCSDCACRCVNAGSAACISSMNNAWNKISTKPLPIDAWGNILMFDENEWQSGPTGCSPDVLRSPGPDHILGSGSCSANVADDISMTIPLFFCS